nr:MAG TPA: hypothetical protein [Caudoviricetes sp.]
MFSRTSYAVAENSKIIRPRDALGVIDTFIKPIIIFPSVGDL